MNYHGTCENCHHHSSVDWRQIALYGSRLPCPTCAKVMDFAAVQAAQPGISQQTKEAWISVGLIAFLIGLGMLFKKLDQMA